MNNLSTVLQQAQAGDKEAQLTLSRYYFSQRNGAETQRWFVPLLEASYPPALLCKVDFMFQQNKPHDALSFLQDLAQHDIPTANYRLALILYFHAEVPMDFQEFLVAACQLGEIPAVIAAASLFYRLDQPQQAVRLLTAHQADSVIKQLMTATGLTPDNQAVDFSLLRRPVEQQLQPNILDTSINLVTLGHFLSDFDCEWLKMRSQDHLGAAYVVDASTGQRVISDVRNCQSAQLLPAFEDWILLDFENRIANVLAIPRSHGEVPNVLYYQPGEHYKVHYDFFHPNDPGREVAMRDGGQRIKTVLCYLNTPNADENGSGETAFPRLNISVKGEKGMLLIFNNTDAQGEPLKGSLHQSVKVTSGDKWLFSKWIRQKPTSYVEELKLLHL